MTKTKQDGGNIPTLLSVFLLLTEYLTLTNIEDKKYTSLLFFVYSIGYVIDDSEFLKQ